MKHKHVKVGQTVKVKKELSTSDALSTFCSYNLGRRGIVHSVEPLDFEGDLTVQVLFSDGETDWGNHKDIKLIEDVD